MHPRPAYDPQIHGSGQSLEQTLYRMISLQLSFPKKEAFVYKMNDQMAFQVIEDAVSTLTGCGIILPQKIEVVFTDDLNCQMCQSEKI